MKKTLFVLIILYAFLQNVFSQDLLSGNKIWYSTYINYKLNKRLFIDAYLLNGFDAIPHSFSFNQNDFAINYKINKKQTAYFGYTQSFYKWQPYYDKYDKFISVFHTISFNRLFAGFKYKLNIFSHFKMQNDIGAQYYLTQLEKYQIRFTDKAKIYWYNKNWPMKIVPSVQLSVYYYQSGIPLVYYNDLGNIISFKSPNGLHRYRVKFGFSFKPFKSFNQLGIKLYYAIQREFNIKGFGNDLNVIRPGTITDILYPYTPSPYGVKYPFNNFKIFGVQINFILK